MAFNNWPYTNFQDLNLGWILAKIKEALASAAAAVAKAEAVESEVGTYSQRISDAEAEADSARNIANTARSEAINAQSDATSAIAIGQAAQGTASNALSAANNAQDTADTAVDSAATAERNAATALQLAGVADTNAQNALNDIFRVHIQVDGQGGVDSRQNVDNILNAVLAEKKIEFTLDDGRNGVTYVTYDYIIDPVENTSNDIDILVFFDTSVSGSSLKYFLVTFTKRVGTGGLITYATMGGDSTFSGGGGSASGAVLYDSAQILTGSEKKRARQNIDAKPNYTLYNNSSTSGTFTIPDNSYYIISNVLTGAITIAFGADDVETSVHERAIRFTTGSDLNSCLITLPSAVHVPTGFYSLVNYLLPDTTYELVFIGDYMSFNYWG